MFYNKKKFFWTFVTLNITKLLENICKQSTVYNVYYSTQFQSLHQSILSNYKLQLYKSYIVHFYCKCI